MFRKNKYNVAPKAARTYRGIVFDSKKEMNRYCELKILVDQKIITELEMQPRYDLIIEGKRVGFWKADFRYVENGKTVVEDVKGVKTPIYKLKKKMVEAIYGIEILET